MPRKRTKAPKSIILVIEPWYILPISGSATIPIIQFRAASPSSFFSDAILTTPSSVISILVCVVSTISRITFPPVPITSRILSTGILIATIRGALSETFGRGSEIALAISPRI